MAWIPRPAAEPAEGKRISPVLEPLLHSPKTLEALGGISQAVTFGGSSLGRRREELLSTAVSALNDCFF